MFKRNSNRPPITISLRKVNTGYKVLNNDSFNPFSFKKITRAVFKNQLQSSRGPDGMMGSANNSAYYQQSSHVTMPSSAKWFDYDNINNVEKEAFPQFFLQEDQPSKLFKKSPRLYRFYRNFIVSLWRENPKKYLSPSICRKNLPGDVSAIIRIHAFLQHWGLINFPTKQHSKGYVQEQSCQYFCHVCQQTNSSEYYMYRLDDETTFQICFCCFNQKIYPAQLSHLDFIKIIPQVHNENRRKKISADQIQKMLQIMSTDTSRQKDLWTNLSQALPNYTKQQLILNFLQIPKTQKMNANIFTNNQDQMSDQQPVLQQSPTIFQDYENQTQIQIAMAYYLWKQNPQKWNNLTQVFETAQRNAKKLAQIQGQKCTQMIRMLIDVQQSKLEFKTIFIQEFDKLVSSEIESYRIATANLMAQELKNVQNQME